MKITTTPFILLALMVSMQAHSLLGFGGEENTLSIDNPAFHYLNCDPEKIEFNDEAKAALIGVDGISPIASSGLPGAFFDIARNSFSESFQDWSLATVFNATCEPSLNKYFLDSTCSINNDDDIFSKSFGVYKKAFLADLENAPYCILKRRYAKEYLGTKFNSKMNGFEYISEAELSGYKAEVSKLDSVYTLFMELSVNEDKTVYEQVTEQLFNNLSEAVKYRTAVKREVGKLSARDDTSPLNIKYEKAKIRITLISNDTHSIQIKTKYRKGIIRFGNLFKIHEYIQLEDYTSAVAIIRKSLSTKEQLRYERYLETLAIAAESPSDEFAKQILTSLTAPSDLWKIKQRTNNFSISGLIGVKYFFGTSGYLDDNDSNFDSYGPVYLQLSRPISSGSHSLNIGFLDLGNAIVEEEKYSTGEEKDALIEDSVVFSIGYSRTIGRTPFKYGLDFSYRQDNEAQALNVFLGYEFGILTIN